MRNPISKYAKCHMSCMGAHHMWNGSIDGHGHRICGMEAKSHMQPRGSSSLVLPEMPSLTGQPFWTMGQEISFII